MTHIIQKLDDLNTKAIYNNCNTNSNSYSQNKV